MIDVRINLQVPLVYRPQGDMQAVHAVVPYAQHGLDTGRRSAGLGAARRRPPATGGGRPDHAGLVDDWA